MPRTISPTHYALRLRPDITQATFDGHVLIDMIANEPVSQVVLNAIELEVDSIVVTSNGKAIDVASYLLDEATERMIIDLDGLIAAGPAQLEIAFAGALNDKLRGFYRSSFSDDDGAEHTIATTQFESTNARRCFPCWDEPDRKATFGVTLDVAPGMLAVSAQAEIGRATLDDGATRIEFGTTPSMSTYLLAFVVGELEASTTVEVLGIPVRVIHRPGRQEHVDFALDAAVFCLEWLTDYFGVPYFGNKIDLLAIPDFAFGAMENTGCVTFREVLLLVDPETTTQPEQQRSVAVIAHELAHMWFGNLVTMQWWEGLWLKEAFATFMETSATDAYRPDWKVWDGFALDRSAAYAVDALHSTRPIEYEVFSPADAEGMYDVLTYEKGASVVRMLEQHVGADRFREGIQIYMRDHAFANTVTSDLWKAIEFATDMPVDEIMHEWIYAGGFPLVDASLVDGELALDQRPFHLLEAPSQDSVEWKIPVSVDTGGETTRQLLTPHGRIPLDNPDAMIIVDPANEGFFRVRYDPVLAGRLGGNLMALTAGQRYALFDDLFDLVLAGLASIGDYVSLTSALSGEVAPPVWSSAAGGYATLAHLAPNREGAALIGGAWSAVALGDLRALGFEKQPDESDPLVNEVRATLFSSLGSLSREPEVIAHARAIFGGAISADNASVESAAIRVIASTGSRADYDEVFSRFQNAASPQVERRYMFAMARFDDAGAIGDLCARTLDGSIRSQDAAAVLGLALGNRWHGGAVWDFISTNWEQICETAPDNALGGMLSGVRWLEHADHQAIHSFLQDHPVPQAKLAIAQHLERLQVHVGVKDRFVHEVANVTAV